MFGIVDQRIVLILVITVIRSRHRRDRAKCNSSTRLVFATLHAHSSLVSSANVKAFFSPLFSRDAFFAPSTYHCLSSPSSLLVLHPVHLGPSNFREDTPTKIGRSGCFYTTSFFLRHRDQNRRAASGTLTPFDRSFSVRRCFGHSRIIPSHLCPFSFSF